MLIHAQMHLRLVLPAYVTYFHGGPAASRQQAAGARRPVACTARGGRRGPTVATPVLGGLPHAYQRAAYDGQTLLLRTDGLTSQPSRGYDGWAG